MQRTPCSTGSDPADGVKKIVAHPEIWTAERPSRWPDAPGNMSVTALNDIEACPRRWALRHADYPKLWGGYGYPPRLHMGALLGSVTHLALETIVREFIRTGCPSVKDATAVSVMRNLGGYTHILYNCIDRVISRLRENPRARRHLGYSTQFLRARIPQLRTQVQAMLSRTRLEGRSQGHGRSSTFNTPLATGTYAELDVSANRIGWKGKLDILAISPEACEIIDFKTGAPDDVHRFQIEVYSLLWTLDEERNPQGRSADRLILAYDNGEVEVPVPSPDRYKELEQELLERRAGARASVAQCPPQAKPDPVNCRSCQVRHLCDEYWASEVVRTKRYDETRKTHFGDCEVTIAARHGPSSWDARIERPWSGLHAVVRTAFEGFKVGDRLRLLDGALLLDEEDRGQPWVITLGMMSEIFMVSRPPHAND